MNLNLLDLYSKQSVLNVAVVGSNYASKEWCGLEWDVFLDMIKKDENDRVFLIRADDGEVPGLLSTHGYAHTKETSTDELAALILERFKLVASSLGAT